MARSALFLRDRVARPSRLVAARRLTRSLVVLVQRIPPHRSGKQRSRTTRPVRWCCALAVACIAACSASPRATQTSTAAAIPSCTPENGFALQPDARETIASLKRAVEDGPIFAASAARTGVASCRVAYDGGVASIDYQLRDGGWLRAKRDAKIEYSDQEARLTTPLAEDAVGVLQRAERASFGADGCGIDWKEPESKPPDDDRSAVEKIYRGETCNCQARVRSDASGKVFGLMLRSSC
jgi:hypothetical protein